jgi:hypothetical protein
MNELIATKNSIVKTAPIQSPATIGKRSRAPRATRSFSFAEIMNWQNRLEKTVIALNLISLALGFGTLGICILVKGEQRGESWISGVLGIVVGSLFLLFAFYFCKHTWGRWLGKAGLRETKDCVLPQHRTDVPD